MECQRCKLVDELAVESMMKIQTLERELAELRQLYELDTQWLKAENAALKEQHKKRSLLKDALEENAAMADAMRCRIGFGKSFDDADPCPHCFIFRGMHAETCRHFATERKVMGEPGYAPGDCYAENIRKVYRCIGLLNSMVRGGEQHSDTSARMTVEALDALDYLEKHNASGQPRLADTTKENDYV